MRNSLPVLALLLLVLTATLRADPPLAPLANDVDLLVRMNVISSPDDWLRHATENELCDGMRVRQLLLRMAHVFESVSGFEAALEVLEQRNIIWNDYWADQAVEGGQCKGQYVAIKFELSPRYAQRRGNVPVMMESIHSLVDLARDEPSHRRVLDMPFAHFVLWTHAFMGGEGKWRHGFSGASAEAEYRFLDRSIWRRTRFDTADATQKSMEGFTVVESVVEFDPRCCYEKRR